MTVGSAISTEVELADIELIHMCPEKALKLRSQGIQPRPH